MNAPFHFTPRPGTCDANVFRSIVELNEYRLPSRFSMEDTVVDIGGHVGSFTRACFERGAGHIVAFEPEPGNFALLCDHLGLESVPGIVRMAERRFEDGRLIKAVQAPVWSTGGLSMSHTGYLYDESVGELNTGGGSVSVVASDFTAPPPGPRPLVSMGMDEVIELVIPPDESIRLLKLDCEGAEWEILWASELRRVRQIVGEYHGAREGQWPRSWPGLEMRLAALGFGRVVGKVTGAEQGLGLFFAER